MTRTTAAGSVDNLYVDEDLENEIQGTSLVAEDRNAIQEELLAIIEGAGLEPSSSNLAQVWAALTKGAGSNVDADKLDGKEGADYLDASNLNAGTIPSDRLSASILLELLLTVDGSGSGLDADKLDGAQKDTDTSLSGDSDSSIPTEKAVKTYVDAHKNNTSNPHSVSRSQLGVSASEIQEEVDSALEDGSICPFAVGAYKIQFPGESAPGTLWSGTTWSAQFESEGIFFRTPGGYASSFNSGIQMDAMQRITGSINVAAGNAGPLRSDADLSGVFSSGSTTYDSFDTSSADGVELDFDSADSTSPNSAKTNDYETRPKNRTIRVWKRTA
ncbi:MAG: hypothetical protein PQJ59_01860 [Spirochaetales bacterium]|nr:hypothetical protein [Spirochaetales bacterium]